MPGVEEFTILAVLEARDRASEIMSRVDESFQHFAGTARATADTAAEAGTIIDESMLRTASGADALDVANARVSASRTKLEAATRAQAEAELQLINIQRQVAASGQTDAEVLNAQVAAINRFNVAQREAAAAARGLRDAETSQAAAVTAATGRTDAAAASSTRLASAQRGMVAAASAAHKGSLFVAAGAAAITYESIKAATEYQTLTTRLVTSAGEQMSKLGLVRKGMLDISNETATSSNEEAKAMYYVEAAGYHAAQGLEVLKAASQGAKAEGADVTTVSKALTDVLVDYHLKAGAAADVTSKMVVAISHGKTNLEEFSGAFASIIPAASAAGISFNDAGATLAEMTNHGFTARRAAMNLAQALRSLLNPTNTMKKALDQFGGSTKTLREKLHGPNGLSDAMQYLSTLATKAGKEGTPEFAAALKNLVGTAAGANAALGTTGENFAATQDIINQMAGTTTKAGQDVKGFGEIQETMGFKVDQAKAAIHNAGVELGTVMLPVVTRIIGEVAKMLVPLTQWIAKHQTLTRYILIGAIALGVLTLAISAITAVVTVLFSEVGLIVLAIAALALGVYYCYTHFSTFRTILADIGTFMKTVFVGAWQAVGAVVQWFSTDVMGKLRSVMNGFKSWWKTNASEVKQVWHALWDYCKVIVTVWWNVVLKPMLTIWKRAFITTWDFIRDATKMIWTNIGNVIKFWVDYIRDFITVVLDVITGHWGKAWKDLKKLASDAMSNAVTAIKDAASGFGTLLWDAGQNVIKGLIGGMKSMIGGVKDIISNVASTIWNHLPHSPVKEGPLSGSGSPELSGRTIIKMLTKGMMDNAPLATQAMHHVTNAIAGQASGSSIRMSGTSLAALSGGAGGGGNVTYLDLRGSQVMSDRDMDALVNKIGNRLATRTLPAGGTHIRM
jgi:TP901 family phage tail tape measure protein